MALLRKMERLSKREQKEEEEISSDPYFKNPENVAAILESLEEVKRGECRILTREEQKSILLRTKEDIRNYLGLTDRED